MINISMTSFTNATNTTDRESDTEDVPSVAGSIIIIIINTITCPITVLLNLLVIKAVKTTPRLRTNSNILLACLAVTDVLAGLIGQPLFIMWRVDELYGFGNSETLEIYFVQCLVVMITASYLHLMLVTLERLIAIKFSMQYSDIVTYKNMRIAVLAAWIIPLIIGVFRILKMVVLVRFSAGLLIISCVLFLTFSYFIMYRETRRHRHKIKTQQLPQEEVERFAKENKALKTTVFVVGAVIVCLLPLCFCLIVTASALFDSCPINVPSMLTCAMINSLVNPLIYCWRQKEMKKVILGRRTRVEHLEIQLRRGRLRKEWAT
ncbi:trace amine-associated receptor 5-like [Stylophora pistillata]|uniref:trace amine-associated receptor 5-like n=1 Tax=Stylophora pistillata TaxID=50429 RepID=UPI000C057C1C|nr:trace amine-associated receptor 5-like [Stylophora pistillata]